MPVLENTQLLVGTKIYFSPLTLLSISIFKDVYKKSPIYSNKIVAETEEWLRIISS